MKPWTPTAAEAADLIGWADTRDAIDPDSSFFSELYAELVADAADPAASDPTLSPVGSAAPTTHTCRAPISAGYYKHIQTGDSCFWLSESTGVPA